MLVGAILQYFFGITIFVLSIFLIVLVLLQRGRGGGLTGALGGPGGQSAFGTRAGDVFTRITVVVATIWIFLCAASVVLLRARGRPTLDAVPDLPAISGAATEEAEAGAGSADATVAPQEGGDSASSAAEVSSEDQFGLDGISAPAPEGGASSAETASEPGTDGESPGDSGADSETADGQDDRSGDSP